MRERIKANRVRDREYWTPAEASLVLGRGARFWRNAFDKKQVKGYPYISGGGRRYRYINAESAREFLRNYSDPDNPPLFINIDEAVAAFKERMNKDK